MRRHVSLVIIIASLILLAFFDSVVASSEGQGSKQEAGSILRVMAADPPLEEAPSVEEYINRTNAEPVQVILYASNPVESRRLWQENNNGNISDSTFLDLMGLIRIQYMEDLNYSSYILDEYVKKKIDSREAMTATMTLFVLTTQTVDMVDQIKPPAKFEEYQNTTQLALINLEGYLWNMIKFYETTKRVYAMQAHDNFNNSMSYYEKGANFSKQF